MLQLYFTGTPSPFTHTRAVPPRATSRNSVGASLAAEVERERERQATTAANPWWRRWRRGR